MLVKQLFCKFRTWGEGLAPVKQIKSSPCCIYPALPNSVDPDRLASEKANWSRYALFAVKYVNL